MATQSPAPIRVLLIDDHRIALWGLERLIEGKKPGMKVVGSATTCTEALKLASKVSSDLIVLDLELGGGNGLEAIPGLIAASNAKVLVLTESRDQSVHDNVVLAGASGIVQKQDAVATILTAIEKIHAGQLWLNHVTTGRVFLQLSRKSAARDVDPERKKIAILTAREREIIVVVATNAGVNARMMAKMLHISESTLRNHFTSIHSKLEVANHMELFVYANKHGLNKPE